MKHTTLKKITHWINEGWECENVTATYSVNIGFMTLTPLRVEPNGTAELQNDKGIRYKFVPYEGLTRLTPERRF